MKNSLELQIISLIKKANYLRTTKKINQSIEVYEKALATFRENISYNCIVSLHFQTLIYSLKGQAYYALGQYQQAEEDFNSSLRANPHDPITLMRRAKLLCQINRFSQAIQDAQKVFISDPDGLSLHQLIEYIKNKVQKIEDKIQKQRLIINIQSITNYSESFQECNAEQQFVSFSNLKQIDRESRGCLSSLNKIYRKKISAFQSEYLHDDNQQNSSKNQTYSEQRVENNPIIIINKGGYNYGNRKKQNIRNFRKCLSINFCQDNQLSSILCKGNQSSMKSIDNKLQKRTSVRFIQNDIATSSQNNFIKQGEIQNKVQKPKRKSCLRNSKIDIDGENKQSGQQRHSTGFMELKNIDGNFIPSSFSNLKQKSNQTQDKKISQDDDKDFSDSGQENETKQHDIYGQKYRTSKVLKCLQNLQGWSGKKIQGSHRKNGSILKKDSIIGSQRDTKPIRSQQHKKSVCFIDKSP